MRALITRPLEDAEEFVAELHAAGIASFVEPLLHIVPIPEAVARLDTVQAVLLTSRNGARALAEATGQRDVPVFAVGDATADTARELGFSNVESAAGDAAALAELIGGRLDPGDGPLLHGSGTAVAGDLAGGLAARGFTVRCEILYEARPATKLSRELQTHLMSGELEVATFFSPRTARTFVTLVGAAGLASTCRAVTAVCISPAVARALGALEFGDIRVASRPDGPAMIAATVEARARLKPVSEKPQDTDQATDHDEPELSAEPDDPAHAGDPAGAKIEIDTQPETAIETSVPPEDNKTDSEDVDRTPPLPSDQETDQPDIVIEPEKSLAKRGGRAETWWVLIALAVVGAGIVSYPKWKSQIPARFLPGGQITTANVPNAANAPDATTAPNAATVPDKTAVAIDGLRDQIRRLRAEASGAASAANAAATDIAEMATRLAAAEAALKRPTVDAAQLAAIAQRVETLEKRVAGLASAPAAQAAIADRIGRLETAFGGLAAEARKPAAPDPARGRLAAENQRLTAALQALSARLDAVGRELAARDARLAAIETTVETAAARNTGDAAGSRGGALIIAVGQLRDALSRSTPFRDQLASLSAMAAGNDEIARVIAPLDGFADSGIPTAAVLKRRFENLAARTTRVAKVSRDTGWLDRTIASIASVVTVRRVGDDVPGDTAQAVLARAEARVLADDLAGAVRELAKLTGAPKKTVAGWRRDATARLDAERAVAALTRIVINRLAASDGAAAK